MHKIFQFGEKVAGFSVPVLNEREARASAGILFFFSIISLLNVMLLGNFVFIKIFIVAFSIEFLIRVFINPKYAPVMILGRFFVSGQSPEYTGAPQKRFAWSLGLGLAFVMLFSLVFGLFSVVFSCIICFICVFLLFFETSFGICVGCRLYNLFNKNKAELCPGGICEVKKKEDIQKINYVQIIVLIVFIFIMAYVSSIFKFNVNNASTTACGGSSVPTNSSPCLFGNTETGASPCQGAASNSVKVCPF